MTKPYNYKRKDLIYKMISDMIDKGLDFLKSRSLNLLSFFRLLWTSILGVYFIAGIIFTIPVLRDCLILTFLFISKATPTLSKQPAQHLPSDRSEKKSKADEANCFICEKEPDDETDGHEALFCEGDCQGWIYRQCAIRVWVMISLVSQPYLFNVIIVLSLNTIMKLTC